MSNQDIHSEPGASLFDTMNREADARREHILEEARAEAARIIADARQVAEESRTKALEEERLSAAAYREDARQRAQAEAERAIMTMRERVVDKILDTVHEELRAVAQSPGFPELLCRLLAEALEEAPEDAVVLAPPAYAGACRHWLDANGRHGVPVEPEARLWDGIAVTNQARSYRLTNTLTGRFEKTRADARKAAIRRLFGEKP